MDENKSEKSGLDEGQRWMKPSHVRRLNFGQTILTLDAVKEFQGQKRRSVDGRSERGDNTAYGKG